MDSLIQEWIGKEVYVKTVGLLSPTTKAKLLKVDPSGVMLELPKGQTFVPMTAVLHISLLA